MNKNPEVDAYIEKQSRWREALQLLRSLLNEFPLEETIKWRSPVYTLDGKNVIGLGAFKSYVGLWFFQGALLKDPAGRLINAQEGKTRGLRQWRFQSIEAIQKDATLIRQYVQEAIENQRAGRQIKARRNQPIVLPEVLQQALAENQQLAEKFAALTPGRQREYAEYLAEAKREETRQKRLEKIIPLILEGRGLHDRYRR